MLVIITPSETFRGLLTAGESHFVLAVEIRESEISNSNKLTVNYARDVLAGV